MIKLKTSNTFTGGMILDTSPLVASLQTLSNALNATLVTNDGDEGALQNDMGNIRVLLIKLSKGFTPVGVCSYGGVMYIASYNPETKEGEIGSFPSPIESEESPISNRSVSNISSTKFELQSRIFGENKVIRPGDLFDLFHSLDGLKNKISHFDNVYLLPLDGGLIVKSPKNKDITVSICVLDSNGGLRDITPYLYRFDENGKVLEYNDDPEILLNTGYLFKEGSPAETDTELDNTYNYKTSGPLYIVYHVNALDSYEVSLQLYKNNGEELNLSKYDEDLLDITLNKNEVGVVADVSYIYNSPDGNYDTVIPETPATPKYLTLKGMADDYNLQMVYGLKVSTMVPDDKDNILDVKGLPFDSTESIYNELTNTYSVNNKYYWPLISGDKKQFLFEFVPSTRYGELSQLLQTLNINLDNLNTGQVSVLNWRYYYDTPLLTINFDIEAYPFYGTSINAVRLKFYDLFKYTKDGTPEPDLIYTLEEKSSYFGSYLRSLQSSDLSKASLYVVEFEYDLITGSKEPISISFGKKPLLTTSLYNAYYTENKFGDILVLTVNPVFDILGSGVNDNSTTSVDGNPSSEDRTITKQINVSIPLTLNLSPINEEIYPFKISSESQGINSVEIKNLKTLTDVSFLSNSKLVSNISEKEYSVPNRNNQSSTTYTYDINYSEDTSNPKEKLNTLKVDKSVTNINITGTLQSKFKVEIKNNKKTFDNIITLIFPKEKVNVGSLVPGCIEDHYYNTWQTDKKSSLKYIITGVTSNGRGGGYSDWHQMKVFDINGSENSQEDIVDLMGTIWNSAETWPSTIFQTTDGNATFNFNEFLEEEEFLKSPYAPTILILKSAGHKADYYNESTVTAYRRLGSGLKNEGGSHDESRNMRGMATFDNGLQFVFLKSNNKYCLLTHGTASSRLLDYQIPDYLGNIYGRCTTSVDTFLCKVPDLVNAFYNKNYDITFDISVKVTAKFNLKRNNSEYNNLVYTLLLFVKLNKEEKKEFENLFYFKLKDGDWRKGDGNKTLEHPEDNGISYPTHAFGNVIHMLGSEYLYNKALEILSKYDTVLITSRGDIIIEDCVGQPLDPARIYELDGNKAYLYGTKSVRNSENSKFLNFNITQTGVNVNIRLNKTTSTKFMTNGGSGDLATSLYTGPLPVLNLSDNNTIFDDSLTLKADTVINLKDEYLLDTSNNVN